MNLLLIDRENRQKLQITHIFLNFSVFLIRKKFKFILENISIYFHSVILNFFLNYGIDD